MSCTWRMLGVWWVGATSLAMVLLGCDGSVGSEANSDGSVGSEADSDGGSTDVTAGGAGFEFVRIPAGTFTMGSPEDEVGRASECGPEAQVEVTLSRDFYLQTTPVTGGQFEALMNTDPATLWIGCGECQRQPCGPDCTMSSVDWLQAAEFANALSAAEGLAACYDEEGRVVGGATIYDCEGYRLPTAAEWEYAARAGTTTATYNGDVPGIQCDETLPVLDAIAWYTCTLDTSHGDPRHPVGQKLPNAWGLRDMLGIVWEWTDTPAASERLGGVDPTGPPPNFGGFWPRVLRGGSLPYVTVPRAACSIGLDYRVRDPFIGFRLARTAP